MSFLESKKHIDYTPVKVGMHKGGKVTALQDRRSETEDCYTTHVHVGWLYYMGSIAVFAHGWNA